MRKILRRAEVPVEETWDLSPIFPSDDAMLVALAEAEKLTEAFHEAYHTGFLDASSLTAALSDFEELLTRWWRVESYVSLQTSVDMLNAERARLEAAVMQRMAQMQEKVAFFENAISALDRDVIAAAQKNAPGHARFLDKILQRKAHLLDPAAEEALAAFAPILNAPERLYDTIKFKDIAFPSFAVGDQTYEMTYPIFENRYETDADPALRRAAAEAFYAELARHAEGTAAVYNVQVKRECIEARLRGYDSAIDMLLAEQEVPRELYDRQIDGIMTKLAPIMRRYARLLQKKLGLARITTFDLKAELDPTFVSTLSFADAQAYIRDGLSLLGPEYGAVLERAFGERWIDYAENLGKENGAFAASIYDVHPYVMTSFNHKMDEVATLAHELGHVGANVFASQAQGILNADMSMYMVEVPSTTNELIMEHYLLEKAGDDARMRQWVISQIISKTYYHNFVTHGLEAAYQREVYRLVEAGKSLDAETLSGIYHEVLTAFWGDSVVVEPASDLLWMRQSHYYAGLYSYTYSASLTIGTQIALGLMDSAAGTAGTGDAENGAASKDKSRVTQYLDFLRAGGSLAPVELAALAGVDITTETPLNRTFDYIDRLVTELENGAL
ncbi:MAG: oligoendopeptidase F [Peptoniphilaceae bacterium]|nr:oligoendopeptidase F [Peptoniphilaceae bacterium]MDY6085501.1 oligoendopeptidase F [Peptoniphilaceae bacterium]